MKRRHQDAIPVFAVQNMGWAAWQAMVRTQIAMPSVYRAPTMASTFALYYRLERWGA